MRHSLQAAKKCQDACIYLPQEKKDTTLNIKFQIQRKSKAIC